MARTIIHIDLDAFFCAVEELHHPALRGLPFAVGGRPDQRGVVASCSYPARAFGVRSAMPMSRALSLCPQLEIIPARHGEYGVHSRKVMAILRDLTPLVEQLSIDEAFIDVTGRPDAGHPLAAKLQTQINQDLGLPVSLGVAGNKLIAKTANTIGKAEASQHSDHPPNAIKVIPPGQEAAFLAPLDIRELWGVGPKTADRLRALNIHTIGDIAAYNPAVLQTFFGKHGADLHRRAQGIDTRRVTPEHETKSISKETTFAEDVRERDVLQRTVRRLADGVGLRLRRDDLYGTTVKIKLRWSDFSTITRQTTLDTPVNHDEAIYQTALELLRENWRGQAVRLIGVGISGLTEKPARQLSLWDAPQSDEERKLQSTLDTLKDRFGEKSIQRGSTYRRKRDE
jgi:DNA polymerase IV